MKVGATIFADFTLQSEPEVTDANGERVDLSSFNIGRAYLNVTGNLNRRIAFRVTPEVTRETGNGSSLNGSYTTRLKFAYAQLNLDEWTTKGSWIRLGMIPTPYNEYVEGIYRYRFQGALFPDREGFIGSSDNGVAMRWMFPRERGDVTFGLYNGEGFNRAETNDQKSLQMRATVRPFTTGAASGLRLGLFVNQDHYAAGAERQRIAPFVIFESPRGTAGLEMLSARDQTTRNAAEVEARGFSLWATPRLTKEWEILARHDKLEPNRDLDGEKTRDIVGVSYWVPQLQKVTAAVMLDGERVEYDGINRPDETRYALHLLVNY